LFDTQEAVIEAFRSGQLHRDVIVVVRAQGPRANGMPELHQLTPALASLQSKGFKVALVTDGRMSGASGSVPAAIHLSPEFVSGGPIGRLRDGDIIELDCHKGRLEALVAAEEWNQRSAEMPLAASRAFGHGRELFYALRSQASGAEQGGGISAAGL
jgi:phosphogluconate dehydratase